MSREDVQEYEVALIGAGPIGIEMAVALKTAGIRYVHFESRQVGHTISWFPRQSRFFSSPERISICGVPLLTVDQSKASREEYLAYLLSVVQQFDLAVRRYETVTRIEKIQADGGGRFEIHSEHASQASRCLANKVIVAIGDMHGPRPLAHPSMGTVEGVDLPHVSQYFDEPHPYVGQNLLIVGGKNSAAEAAVRCYRAGAKVTLCHRDLELSSSIKYWLKPELEWLIKSGEIKQFAGHVPVKILPNRVELAPVGADRTPTLEGRVSVPADFVLLLIGYVMDPTLLANAGVELMGPGKTPRINPNTMESNVPGLYVAGTAAAGTQLSFKLFIENCHAHVVRILREIAEREPQHINPLAYARLNEHPIPAES